MTRIYTLYLSTQITSPVQNLIVPLNKTNLSNVTWLVDFNSLFRGNQTKYNRCTLKYKLTSSSFDPAGTDWDTKQGILTCNLPCAYGSSTNNGTVLGLLYPQTSLIGGPNHCFISDTLETQGVEINVPQTIQAVTFSFMNDDALTFIDNTADWQILLQFELSEEKLFS